MNKISHRGNLRGPNENFENNPDYIRDALKIFGLSVELDCWKIGKDFYLGHDKPIYKIDKEFLLQEKLLIHCKNYNCLVDLYQESELEVFWHEEDKFALTSKKRIVVNSKISNSIKLLADEKIILVDLDNKIFNTEMKNSFILTDYVFLEGQ